MKSAWADRDAQDAIAHYGKAGIAPDLALRVYTTRLLGRDPTLVLHGGGNTSVKTRMRDLIGDDGRRPLRQGLGLGHGDHRARRPARGAARAAAQAARAATRCPTRTWSSSSAPICSIRRRPTRRSKRCCTPSCRTNSSTTRMRPPCSAIVDQPDGRRDLRAKLYGGRMGYRAATSCRASRWRKGCRRCVRRRIRRSRA